ncbi:MAG TPA: glutaredoxin domain-containing protein [Cyclobacteriaceae bacterium]|nr:glutaredoxin domain-containing protein [Cyclobacteriaceae bacterium]
MTVFDIKSYLDLENEFKGRDMIYLLLYRKGSEECECARKNIESAAKPTKGIKILAADVNVVRDIHSKYNIDSVPTLIGFEEKLAGNIIKGCHHREFYEALFEHTGFETDSGTVAKPVKRVTVYSTPSCPWCTTLKNYLRKNGIRFTDIDVSRDERSAEEMVRKSGHQGVPQTDINGSMVIGFDQKKINQLLEIKTN